MVPRASLRQFYLSQQHGWRAFAEKIAINVIGVLFALGARLIENRNDRTHADDAMAAPCRENTEHDFTAREIGMNSRTFSSKLPASQSAPDCFAPPFPAFCETTLAERVEHGVGTFWV